MDPSASVKKIFAFSLGGLFGLSKELRELIPHIGPLPIVIPPKIFLERVGFPADNISSRVAWKNKSTKACWEGESCDECKTREDKEGLSSLNGK